MRTQPLYQHIASTLQARRNCEVSNNKEWYDKHSEALKAMEDELPSGSGIDCGTKIDLDRSTPNKIVLTMEYHHMNDVGMYNGWTAHDIIITPSLQNEFDMRITGRDRNYIKECLYETYHEALQSDTYDVSCQFDILSRRNPGYELTSEWINGHCQIWHCHDVSFTFWLDAQRWAVERMELVESQPKGKE